MEVATALQLQVCTSPNATTPLDGMRTAQQAKEIWDAFFSIPDLSLEWLRGCSRGQQEDNSRAHDRTIENMRGVCWRLYLEYLPGLNVEEWPGALCSKRNAYAKLKESVMFDPAKAAAGNPNLNNPLSLADDSPWTEYFKDTELKKLIVQDVDRTFPDIPFFRERDTHRMLVDTLFVWCKTNPDISYRQGMHELLAPILLVLDREKLANSSDTDGLPPEMLATYDSNYIENDAAQMFFTIMKSARTWYQVEPVDVIEPRVPSSNRFSQSSTFSRSRAKLPQKVLPIVTACRRVQCDLLRALDYDLYEHLDLLSIEPQLYALRWFRLLFGREFPMPQLLVIWDGIFGSDRNLELVEWLCVALLIHMKQDLMQGDMATCLTRLMKFYTPDQLDVPVSSFTRTAHLYRERYIRKATILSANETKPTQAATTSPPTSPPLIPPAMRKARSHAPWANYTNVNAIAPKATPVVTPNSLHSSTAINPADQNVGPRRSQSDIPPPIPVRSAYPPLLVTKSQPSMSVPVSTNSATPPGPNSDMAVQTLKRSMDLINETMENLKSDSFSREQNARKLKLAYDGLLNLLKEFDGAGTVGADHSGKEKTEHSDKSQSQSTSDVRRSIEFAKSKPAMPPVAEEESKPVSLGPESKKSENTATQVVDLPGQSKKDEAANEALLKPVSSNVSIASASTEKSSPDFIPANEVSPNAVMDLPSGMEDPWLERDSQRQNVNTQDNWLESLTDQSTDNGWTVVGEAELTTRQTAYNDSSTQSNENASSASPGVEVTLSDKPAASKPPVSQPRRRASNRSVSSLSAEQSSRQLYGRASSSSISTLASRQSHRNSLPSGPPDPLGAVAAVVDSLSGSIARVVRKTPIGVYPFAGDADPLS